jgi:ubiquitin thioesterase OTU1
MPEADVTLNSLDSHDLILAAAKVMAQKLKARNYYVDTATFNIICEQCGREFVGEKEAVKHATETGHTSFGQLNGG